MNIIQAATAWLVSYILGQFASSHINVGSSVLHALYAFNEQSKLLSFSSFPLLCYSAYQHKRPTLVDEGQSVKFLHHQLIIEEDHSYQSQVKTKPSSNFVFDGESCTALPLP